MPMYALQRPDQLTSPQIGAISSGTMPPLHYSSYIESAATALPMLEEAEYNRKVQEEQIRLNNEARAQARRDANWALGLKGTETAVKLGTNPIVRKYGAEVWKALMPKPVIPTGFVSSFATPASEATGFTSALSTQANVPFSTVPPSSIQSAIQPWASKVIPQAPTFASTLTPSAGATEVMGLQPWQTATPATTTLATEAGTKAGVAGTGLTPLKFAGTSALSALSGYQLGSTTFKNKPIEAGLAGAGMGALSGWSAGALAGSVVPGIGTVLGAIFGGIGGAVGSKNKSLCMITSSCYGSDSYETNITREYRDKYLDKNTLKGYYYIADKIVPIMEKYPEVKEFVKAELIDPIIKYGEWKLDYKIERPTMLECAIVKNFLTLCENIGKTMDLYVRSNGENI